MPPGTLRDPQANLTACRDCAHEVSRDALACPQCGAPRPARAVFNGEGYEWKSQAQWLGMPVVHIAFGSNAQGKPKVARGVVAIGQIAHGGLAIGISAVGFIAVGVVAFGAVSLGTVAVALLAAGGVQAVAPLAYGVSAVGWWVGGVAPFGMKIFSGPGA